ncbi:13589_t:CDS:2, partial [Gigaspora margarita]
KLQREDIAAIETPTLSLEFNMDISNNYEPVDTDMKTQNLQKVSSIEMSNKPIMDTSELEILLNPWEPTTTHTILEEPPITNAPHSEIKIRDTDGYEELVKKYLQVGQPYKVHRNTLHSTPVTSNQH